MNKHINRIHKIDLLRGVAIIFVVCFHFMWHYSPEYLLRDDNWSLKLASYGWTGVDIFFIVSGFCIAMTIEKIPNLLEFYDDYIRSFDIFEKRRMGLDGSVPGKSENNPRVVSSIEEAEGFPVGTWVSYQGNVVQVNQ